MRPCRAPSGKPGNILLNTGIYSQGMLMAPQPLRFSHHALAVLASALLGSTVFAVLTTVAIAILSGDSFPGGAWLVWLAIASWFAAFVLALPGAAILFSLLWPTTRHGTAAGTWLCVIGGAVVGILAAPLASARHVSASPRQMILFAVTGAAFGLLYVFFARRLARSSGPHRASSRSFRHRLPAVAIDGEASK